MKWRVESLFWLLWPEEMENIRLYRLHQLHKNKPKTMRYQITKCMFRQKFKFRHASGEVGVRRRVVWLDKLFLEAFEPAT